MKGNEENFPFSQHHWALDPRPGHFQFLPLSAIENSDKKIRNVQVLVRYKNFNFY